MNSSRVILWIGVLLASPLPAAGQELVDVSSLTNLARECPLFVSQRVPGLDPDFAVDGRVDHSQCWAAGTSPAWLIVDLQEEHPVDMIRLWTWWGEQRTYRFKIEGSTDKKTWTLLVDERDNVVPSLDEPWVFYPERALSRYLRVTFTKPTVGNFNAGRIVELEAYALAEDQRKLARRRLKDFPQEFTVWHPGIYERFHRDDLPRPGRRLVLRSTLCRNEEVPFQLAAARSRGGAQLRVACGDLRSDDDTITASSWRARYVQYVRTLEEGQIADVLYAEPVYPLRPGTIQPIWLSLHVPSDTKPGRYTGEVRIQLDDEGDEVVPVEINVLDTVLPLPRDGRFYLDLCFQSGGMARWHDVQLWSEAHWKILRSYVRLAAEGGQKPIPTYICDGALGISTYHPRQSMVQWRKERDGSYAFDFSVFDRFVQLCRSEGFIGPINCYSPAANGPTMTFTTRVWNVAERRYEQLECTLGDEVYKSVWRQFFDAFAPHLKEKGWIDDVNIGMDEPRNMEKIRAILDIIPPEIHVELAGHYHEPLDEYVEPRIRQYCMDYSMSRSEIMDARRALGKSTTFGICCGPLYPNAFITSPLVEARLMGWHALACRADGVAMWTFSAWTENPLKSAIWPPWTSGDCFKVYPGPRSSVRFEMIKKGIQDFDAWHIAKDRSPDDPRLVEALRLANANHNGRLFDTGMLDQARQFVNDVLQGEPPPSVTTASGRQTAEVRFRASPGSMVNVPAGSFVMGCREGEVGDDDELPRRTVYLDAYEIGTFEVTNSEYANVLNWALEQGFLQDEDASNYTGGEVFLNGKLLIDIDDVDCQISFVDGRFHVGSRTGCSMNRHPVVEVSWYGAVAFCNWLSQMNGLPTCYDLDAWVAASPLPSGYRLATEAEWERAAAWDSRAESSRWLYAFGSDEIDATRCNYAEANPLALSEAPYTTPVGFYNGLNAGTVDSPSPVGCYDMSGNVWEWCHDAYKLRYPAIDERNPVSVGQFPALRGGYWQFSGWSCRAANRTAQYPRETYGDIGFRIARGLQ